VPVADTTLTSDALRQLVRECVTVVRPGEILVLRPGAQFTPDQLSEIQEMVNWWLKHNAPGIKALVVPGEGGQIIRQETAGRCCVCGSAEVVYRNYLEKPFCGPCADGDKPA